MTFRRTIFWLHLLAGTMAGLVILVMSATGVLLAFEAQIVDFAERSVRTVTPPTPDARRLSMDAVIAAARRDHPEAMPTFLSMRAGPTAAVRVDLGRDVARFVDPYTGIVVGQGSVPDRATTATKTDTPLKDIPASIQVVPSELLSQQGAFTIDAIQRDVSGVTQGGSTSFGFFNSLMIRGLNPNFRRDGLFDGAQGNGYLRTITGVERIEVLKGPGSALFGAGDPGGTINIITKAPPARPVYEGSVSGGSFGTHRESVGLGGPLGDGQLLYRLDAAYFHTDGFRDMENTTVEFLPKLAWTLTPDHKVRLDFDYRNYAITPDGYAIPFRGREILDADRDTKYSTPFGRVDQDVYGIRFVYEWTLSESLTWRNAVGILARDLSVLRNDGGTIAPGSIQMTGRSLRRHHQHTQDIDVQSDLLWRVATGPVRHTVLAGFEYLGQTRDYKLARAALPTITNVFAPVIPEQGLDGLRFVPLVEGTTQFDDFGVYLQDQIALSAQWKARAGLRFDRFDTRDRNLVITAVGQQRYESRTDDELSWNAGIAYQPVPATALYGGASRSFVSSRLGFGARNSPPESATQFELGNKTTLLNGRISLNLALFYVTRENVVTFLPGEVLPVTEGKQRSQGFELDLASEPVRGWRLSANYAYTDAELVRLAPNDPAAGKGHRPTGIPENAGAVWTTYELQEGPLRGLGFGGGVRLKGEVFENTLNTQRIPGYVVADLVAFYRRGPWYFQLNVNNVANAKYFSGPTSETVGAVPGEPVSVLASVSIRY